jgi:Family of unknown function (DUF5678)
MATEITLKLPDRIYRRAQQFARLHQQGMEEAIFDLLDQALTAGETGEEIVDWSDPDPAVDREMEAYIAMHPMLKEQYFGKYVAVYQGELIDSDDDPAALTERIDNQFPDEFVWLTQVGPEPIETIVILSPRIIWD